MAAANVEVRVTGIQCLIENAESPAGSWQLSEEDRTEVCVPGFCSERGGRYFLLYEETDPEGSVIHTTVKLEADAFEVSRRGQVVSRIRFAPGGWDESPYVTPFGTIHLGVQVGTVVIRIWRREKEDISPCIIAEADYVTEMDHIPTAKCRVRIEARPMTAPGEEG